MPLGNFNCKMFSIEKYFVKSTPPRHGGMTRSYEECNHGCVYLYNTHEFILRMSWCHVKNELVGIV